MQNCPYFKRKSKPTRWDKKEKKLKVGDIVVEKCPNTWLEIVEMGENLVRNAVKEIKRKGDHKRRWDEKRRKQANKQNLQKRKLV